jgi:hypothetical protein
VRALGFWGGIPAAQSWGSACRAAVFDAWPLLADCVMFTEVLAGCDSTAVELTVGITPEGAS